MLPKKRTQEEGDEVGFRWNDPALVANVLVNSLIEDELTSPLLRRNLEATQRREQALKELCAQLGSNGRDDEVAHAFGQQLQTLQTEKVTLGAQLALRQHLRRGYEEFARDRTLAPHVRQQFDEHLLSVDRNPELDEGTKARMKRIGESLQRKLLT